MTVRRRRESFIGPTGYLVDPSAPAPPASANPALAPRFDLSPDGPWRNQEDFDMTIRTLTIASALATALLCGPAIAADDQTARSVEVRYHDLDLTTAEGASELDRRLDNAVKSVCQIEQVATGSRIVSREARACYKETLEQLGTSVAAAIAKKQRG
jgi:UrcA family protein